MTIEVTTPVAQYDDKKAPGYVKPPAGQRYVKGSDGKVVMNEDGSPKTEAKPKKTRNRSGKAEYARPEGKIQGHETPGYDPETMAVLKETDFADGLDYLLWRAWYFDQRANAARKDAEALKALGATPEERKEAKESLASMNAVRNALKAKAANPAAKNALLEQLAALLAEMS